MAEFSVRRLRKGWAHVLEPEEVRAFVGRQRGQFVKVSLGRPSMSDETSMKWAAAKSWSGNHVGSISAERAHGVWKYTLELCSLRETTLAKDHEAIKALVLADLQAWIDEKQALPPDAPFRGYKLFLEFRYAKLTGILESSCFVPAGSRQSAVVRLAWELPKRTDEP